MKQFSRDPETISRQMEAPLICDWAHLPSEILREIFLLVEADSKEWPERKVITSIASVCSPWRVLVKELMSFVSKTDCTLTFPSDLQLPGPSSELRECYIRRNRKSGVFTLYMGKNPIVGGKFLLSAKKCNWCTTSADYIISSNSKRISSGSKEFLGRLRGNMFSTKFTVHDNFERNSDSKWPSPCYSTSEPRPLTPAVSISYGHHFLVSPGPRRIFCTLNKIPCETIQNLGERGKDMGTSLVNVLEQHTQSRETNAAPFNSRGNSVSRNAIIDCGDSQTFDELDWDSNRMFETMTLKNKPPRWHEQLQCWCLNFRGRVTVASVKNFQLIDDRNIPEIDKPILLQFGKVGKDVFSMDYRSPLSALQAFGICLSSFDTKVACE